MIEPNAGRQYGFSTVATDTVEVLQTQATGPTIKRWQSKSPLSWQLYCGQAKQALQFVDDESIDCVITSPPYFWLRDYQVDGQIGLEDSVEEYVEALTDVMSEVFRVLKPAGTVFLNLGDTYYSGKGQSHGVDRKNSKRRFGLRAVDRSGGLGIGLQRKSIIGVPWRVAIEMCEKNWVLRSPIIWHRQRSLKEYVNDRPARSYEHVFLFVKSRHYFFDKSGLPQADQEDVWSIPVRTGSNGLKETAPFPDKLVEQCLAVGCPPDGKVLDPFCGSGTTMLVALQTGRSAIGVELNESFCDYIRRELGRLA